jgi:hypothetical protein
MHAEGPREWPLSEPRRQEHRAENSGGKGKDRSSTTRTMAEMARDKK